MSQAISLRLKNTNYLKNQRRFLIKQDKNRKFIIFFLIFSIIFLGIIYMIQANGIATDSYKIQENQNQIANLQVEKKALELKLSGIQALNVLEKKAIENLNMTKAENINYISIAPEVAAK